MVKRTLALLTLLCTVSLLQGGSRFLDKHASVADAVTLLDLWIKEQMAHQHLPGMSIGIVYDQQLIWAQGYGYADLERKVPATAQTIYRIGSVTKFFTATGIMLLRDAGKLRLDDPIREYLPWFNIQNPFDDASEVTIWHLLTHTSGLPRNAAFPHWTDLKFPTREELRESLAGQKLVYPPGERVKYSNLGATLAGEVIIAVSGEDYATYIQRHIMDPLNMGSSGVFPTTAIQGKMAIGYQRLLPDGNRKVTVPHETNGMAPMGNIYSTVEDMAKLVTLQFHDGPAGGNHILKGSSLREMRRVHWLYSSWNLGRGLELLVTRRNGKQIAYRTGSISGQKAYLMFSPSEKIAVVCLLNAVDVYPRQFADRAYDAVSPAIIEAVTPKPKKRRKSDPAWKKYLGRYSDPWDWEYRVMILNDQLYVYEYNYPPEESPWDGASLMVPDGGHNFHRASDGKPVTFEMSPDGKVERIRWGYDYIYPQE